MITTTYIPIFFDCGYSFHIPTVSVFDLGFDWNFKQQIAVYVPILYSPESSNYPVIFCVGPYPVTIPYLNITFNVDLCFYIEEALYRPRTLGVGYHFTI